MPICLCGNRLPKRKRKYCGEHCFRLSRKFARLADYWSKPWLWRVKARNYRLAHKEILKHKRKNCWKAHRKRAWIKWYETHQEQMRKWRARYYEANYDRTMAIRKVGDRPARYKEYMRRWRAKNKTRIRLHRRRYYEQNREREISNALAWQRRNRSQDAPP